MLFTSRLLSARQSVAVQRVNFSCCSIFPASKKETTKYATFPRNFQHFLWFPGGHESGEKYKPVDSKVLPMFIVPIDIPTSSSNLLPPARFSRGPVLR